MHKRLATGRPADHRTSISLTNGRKLGVYITSTNCTFTDARCWWSRLKLRTSAPGLSRSEEPRADSHSVTGRSRSWSGNNVRRVGRNSPPRLDRRLEFGHEPTRDTAHSSSSRFAGFWNAPPREVSAPPVVATAQRLVFLRRPGRVSGHRGSFLRLEPDLDQAGFFKKENSRSDGSDGAFHLLGDQRWLHP
jgi:hypothetical protein